MRELDVVTGPIAVRPTCPPSESDAYFFPEDTLDDHRRAWFSKHLRAMREPSLSCGAEDGVEAYRFLFLPTWDHPSAVRVERRGEDCRSAVTDLTGRGGYDPGVIREQRSRRLTVAEWESVGPLVADCELWNPESCFEGGIGVDGTTWILEARKAGLYRVIPLWAPERTSPFRRLCVQIEHLARRPEP